MAVLQDRVKVLIARVRKLAALEEIERLKQARRVQLSLIHPWGWARDLGLNISDYSLEAAARLQQREYHPERQQTYLDNPMRLALIRELMPF